MFKQQAKVIVRMLLVASAGTSAWAQPPGAVPDWWPCVQRYVPELSAAVFWTGDVASENAWQQRSDITALADAVVVRDVPLAQAVARIEQFLGKQGSAASEAAALLVAALTGAANVERDQVMAGIKRFSKRQQMMLERMQEQAEKIGVIERDDGSAAALEELRARQKWDIRVFEDREKLSEVLCEQPVLLERRLFSLGRNITTYLEP